MEAKKKKVDFKTSMQMQIQQLRLKYIEVG